MLDAVHEGIKIGHVLSVDFVPLFKPSVGVMEWSDGSSDSGLIRHAGVARFEIVGDA
jgi:hypothetical protein